MLTLYYMIMLVCSVVLAGVYMNLWHKHFDIHVTLIFVFAIINNLGCMLLATSQTLEAALLAQKVTYIGGCYVEITLMLAVFGLCDISVPRWLRITLFGAATAVFAAVLTIGNSDIYYADVTLESMYGASVLRKVYGPVHDVFLVMQVACFLATLDAVIRTWRRNRQVSRKNLYLLFLTQLVGVVCFFGGKWTIPSVELLPVAYNFALVVYISISYRLSLYDVSDTAIDSLVQNGATGFVSLDKDLNYLGSNQTARKVFPELCELTVDKPMAGNGRLSEVALRCIDAFVADGSKSEYHYERDGRNYQIQIQYLYSSRERVGYQFIITDDTEEQRYIKLLNSFNTELQREVEAKTAHIVEMHDNLVLSMATMVESRDNSTGGHIRRTSEGVRMLVAEMRRDESFELGDEFCRDVIKAAPMHDLGKIAVDDAVLRKPGRFTPEEFEKMKRHSAEGARIVQQILEGTDDKEFCRIAVNVAHYHHERWDGSGYPQGLAALDIPLEARIMAIADVYDALVSKRVYKEAMSFEKADSIILSGMGTQFDPGLERFYVSARPNLEAYYRSLE